MHLATCSYHLSMVHLEGVPSHVAKIGIILEAHVCNLALHHLSGLLERNLLTSYHRVLRCRTVV